MKFSIITPTYNRAYSLGRAIESVLAQSYQNFEMIICDDGSTDETESVIKKYANNLNIKYIKSERNLGVNVARNKAMSIISSESEFVTFLDSDDELLPNAIKNMVETVKKNKDINYFRFGTMYSDSNSRNYLKEEGLVADYEMYLSDQYAKGDWIVALRSNLVRDYFKFEESVNGFEGIAWLRLSKRELVLYDSTVVLRIYANVNDSLLRPSCKNRKYYTNIKNGISLYLNEFEDDLKSVSTKRLAERLYALGDVQYKLDEVFDADLNTVKAFKLDPFNLRIFRNLLSRFKLLK